MKQIVYTLCLMLFVGLGFTLLNAQSLQPAGVSFTPQNISQPINYTNVAARGPASCGPDTVLYPQAKATGLPALISIPPLQQINWGNILIAHKPLPSAVLVFLPGKMQVPEQCLP